MLRPHLPRGPIKNLIQRTAQSRKLLLVIAFLTVAAISYAAGYFTQIVFTPTVGL